MSVPSAPQGAAPIRHKSLSAYFPHLYTLSGLLNRSASSDHISLSRPGDPTDFKDLLAHSICAITANVALNVPKLEPAQRGVGPSHTEVVDNILQELARRSYTRAGGTSETCRDALLAGLTVSAPTN
jgi:hypothetical protein